MLGKKVGTREAKDQFYLELGEGFSRVLAIEARVAN